MVQPGNLEIVIILTANTFLLLFLTFYCATPCLFNDIDEHAYTTIWKIINKAHLNYTFADDAKLYKYHKE